MTEPSSAGALAKLDELELMCEQARRIPVRDVVLNVRINPRVRYWEGKRVRVAPGLMGRAVYMSRTEGMVTVWVPCDKLATFIARARKQLTGGNDHG